MTNNNMQQHLAVASKSTVPSKLNRNTQVCKWLTEQFNMPFICWRQGRKVKVVHPFYKSAVGLAIGLREYEICHYFAQGFWAIKEIHWAQLELLIRHECYPSTDHFMCKCGGSDLIKQTHKSPYRMDIFECDSCGMEFFWKVIEK